MRPSPYRTPSLIARAVAPSAPDRDVALPLALFWCLCALRVAVAIARGETFDTGATIAFIATLVIPFALSESLRRH